MRAVHSTRLSLILITSLAISGCLDSSSSDDDDTSIGRLNYNGFSGLTYRTASQTGITDSQGQFRYYPGETLSLKVGDLDIAQDIPAQQFVTPLEFFADLRAALQDASVNDEGLSSHEGTESQVLDNVPLNNLMRFLISLNWKVNVQEGKGIEIRDRVIQQLNAKLPYLTAPIDFNVGALEFAAKGKDLSPANQLLASICFYPEDDELCKEPPTQEEIDNAPIRPEDENKWDPNIEYQQDLRVKRDRIFDAVRSLDDIDADNARTYLKRELKDISTQISNRYFLAPVEITHSASDTSIKTIQIRQIGSTPQLVGLEAISTRPVDVVVHATDKQSAQVEYFVDGEPGGESEVRISLQPSDTYRWVQKTLRVIIESTD